MTLVAVLASALFGALLGAAAIGQVPDLRSPSRRRRQRATAGQTWLLQAGVRLTPAQFWTGSVALGLATFALLAVTTATPAVAVVPALIVAGLPRAVFARERARRLQAVAAAWPDGLREIVGAVAAGRSLTQALSAPVAIGAGAAAGGVRPVPGAGADSGRGTGLGGHPRGARRRHVRPRHRGADHRPRRGRPDRRVGVA